MNAYNEDMKLVSRGIIEGELDTEEEYLAFWQALVNTGMAWQLEGWYGRTAKDMLDNGVIEPPQY